MTALHEAIGRRRRTLYVPATGESVQQAPRQLPAPAPALPSDPPIYRALLQTWAGRGRTLPGHRDPEWAQLTAPIVRTGQFGSTTPFSAQPMQHTQAGQGPYRDGESGFALTARGEE
ncbi:hypothetical protein [Streptomyces boluensis]|uniref:hypothetical protein n=1 Tax=Streptomyces boluensis TaxID=1775135 RepID=UPI001FE53572|nr:hypothetical protein [Streptomyces boluensis]